MSKSSKKRRQAAKRRKELANLRGTSLLDSSSPVPTTTSPEGPGEKTSPAKSDKVEAPAPLPIGTEELSRKRIEFVLPRAHGRSAAYVFDKKSPAEKPPHNEKDVTPKDTQTIDDILFSKKRKLAEKFEAVHMEDEDKETGKVADSEATPSPHKSKKKRKKGSIQTEQAVETAHAMANGTSNSPTNTKSSPAHNRDKRHVDKGKGREETSVVPARPQLDATHRQLSGRSVEEAVKDKFGLRPRANSTDGELNLPQRGLCDERMVLQTHRWNHEMNSLHQITPRGFVNLGNTCFLNSILQCLAYLPPFCQSLISNSESLMTKNGTNRKLNQGQRLTSNLCSLFQKVHGAGSTAKGGAIAPQSIVKALPSIGSCGSRNGYKFRPGRQEDAHEFLVHLLDAMHDGELRSAGINQHASGWRDRLPVRRLDETTFIHRIFGGYFRSQVRCRKCGYRSNTYDPFLDLSLEVSKKSSNSLLSALAEFTRKETLDSDNQWKCSGCKKYVCPTKQLTVFRPPLTLCVQLKRFAFNSGGFGRAFSSFGAGGWKYGKSNAAFRGGSKITKPIEFPTELNLPLSDGRSCAYALTGVVIHVGGSASSGHYTAYVKKPGKKGDNQWFHADDSFIEPVSEKTVVRQNDAYILFYCRKEINIEFPSPPPREMSAEEAQEFGRARAKLRSDNAGTDEHGRSKKEASESASPKAAQRNGPVDLEKTTVHPLSSALKLQKPKSTADEKRSKPHGASNIRESSSEAKKDSPQLQSRHSTPGGEEGAKDQVESSAASSSSDGSSDDDSSAEDDTQRSTPQGSQGHKQEPENKALAVSVSDEQGSTANSRTRVVVGNTDSRGKVKVMMGPRKKRLWKTKLTTAGPKGDGFHLLGNLGVSRWDEEGDSKKETQKQDNAATAVLRARGKIVGDMQKRDVSRKRKMHLDRWDAVLDQGKLKKTKNSEASVDQSQDLPKKNIFQRIQSGMQRMNRGKAKGFNRQKNKKHLTKKSKGSSRNSF